MVRTSVIHHPYTTDTLQHKFVDKIRRKACQELHNPTFSSCEVRFFYKLLNNKTIVLLNLAKYRHILLGLRPRRVSIKGYSEQFQFAG